MNEGEKNFRAVANLLPAMLWVASAGKRDTFFNTRWLDFTGCTLEEERNHGWAGHAHPADRARCTAAYETAFDAHLAFRVKCRFRRADGLYRWVLVNGTPQFSSAGTFAGYIGTCTEIGEVPMQRRQTLFHERLETIGILAGGIAHDFNNLLASIVAEAETALMEHSSEESCGEELERIRTAALRASEIARELMVYAGRDQRHPEPVDLSRMVDEVLALLRVSINKRARLTTELIDDLPAVVAEPAELRQLVMNLVLNASDALPASGGEIHIATSSVKLKGSEFTPSVAAGDYVRLDVCDTGCGISREVQSRMFEPCFTTKLSGKGLGLSVIQRVVRRYGGAIRYESAPGQGAHFAVLLPSVARAAERHSFAAPQPSTRSPQPGTTLLLVEDEEALRVPISNLLRRRGFRVLEAGDGAAVLEALRDRRDRVDAMLLDLTLPGIPGTDIATEAVRIRPELKIIITSAYAPQAAAPLLGVPQVKGYIRKPYEFRTLTRLLDDVLAGSPGKLASQTGYAAGRRISRDPADPVPLPPAPAA